MSSAEVPITKPAGSVFPSRRAALFHALALSAIEVALSVGNAVQQEAFRLQSISDYVFAASAVMELVGAVLALTLAALPPKYTEKWLVVPVRETSGKVLEVKNAAAIGGGGDPRHSEGGASAAGQDITHHTVKVEPAEPVIMLSSVFLDVLALEDSGQAISFSAMVGPRIFTLALAFQAIPNALMLGLFVLSAPEPGILLVIFNLSLLLLFLNFAVIAGFQFVDLVGEESRQRYLPEMTDGMAFFREVLDFVGNEKRSQYGGLLRRWSSRLLMMDIMFVFVFSPVSFNFVEVTLLIAQGQFSFNGVLLMLTDCVLTAPALAAVLMQLKLVALHVFSA